MTSWAIMIEVGPCDGDDGFVDYLLGEIDNAIESTDVEGIPVSVSVEVLDEEGETP